MTSSAAQPRRVRLQEWLDEYEISQTAIAEKLGIDQSSVSQMLKADTMPTKHHIRLADLGVPSDLLPRAFDKPRGRPPKEPRWPALDHAAS